MSGREGSVSRLIVTAAIASAAFTLGGCDRSETSPPPNAAEQSPSSEPSAVADAAAGEDAAAADAKPAEPQTPPPSPELAGQCPDNAAEGVGILATPKQPAAGTELRLLAATFEGEAPLSVRVETSGGDSVDATFVYRPGVPSATIATVADPPSGKLRVIVGREGEGLACDTVKIAKASRRQRPRSTSDTGVWPVKRKWTGAEEALFSAWVREMFTAPRGEDLAWKALHEVTSDRSRNVLHGHYGWGEDAGNTKAGLYLKPDCADTPYFLRAYYSWKRELPFGFRQCSRGSAGKAPYCGPLKGVVGPPQVEPDRRKVGELGAVQRFFRRTLAWGVHTGNGRTAFGDDDTDFYPLSLSRRTLRPGSIFADPYGHIFVVVELMDGEGKTPGVLYAIDGQPDGSITRKRFWEGNFLWNPDPALGGSGFKAFRPLDVKRADGVPKLASVGDDGIAKRSGYGDVSAEQSKIQSHAFYDRMDALVTPGKRDPFVAQEEAIVALFEAAKVRVTSVQNGEDYLAGGGSVSMPNGYSIFETTGAWENYSTPARDLRLLIAIDLVVGFDAKVARNADVFVAEGESMEELRGRLEAARAKMLASKDLSFTYKRSDGSTWTLSVGELIERAKALEMAYNPNDCPEVRWGAKKGSEERSTCRRSAPAAQRRKMVAYRPWFVERRRPPRGDPGPPVK